MYPQIEFVSVGLATVIDAVLLAALFERRNRSRVVIPIVALIAGATMLHGGAFVRLLLFDFVGVWARQIQWSALVVTTIGLLLIPSAMTHCCWRLLRTGMRPDPEPSVRYAAAYLPMLILLPRALPFSLDPRLLYLNLTASLVVPYAVWTGIVNFGSAACLLLRRGRAKRGHVPQFFTALAAVQVLVGVVQATLLLYAVWVWPEYRPEFQLVVLLAPVLPVALFGYFVVRYNFMQLMFERTLVYGAVLLAVMLFHHVAVLGVQAELEERFRVDFGILEAVLIVGIVTAYPPLRQRVAEALRYLLGERVDEHRKQLRSVAWQMSSLVGHDPEELASWFCHTVAEVSGVKYVAMWLFDGSNRVTWSCGEQRRLAGRHACRLYQGLQEADEQMATPRSSLHAAPLRRLDEEAALAVRLDQPTAGGLVVFGRRGNREFSPEEAAAIGLLVEQLGIMLHNSSLQVERLLAERRALQNEKLSTLGLLAGSIAHEIKNPLSSIKTLATVMAEDVGPADRHAEDLRMILSEVDRLTSTTSQLLSFVKPAPAQHHACSARAALESTLGVMRHWARECGVTITTELDAGPIFIAADETALREIVFNLLKNAIEAAGTGGGGGGGAVDVRCRVESPAGAARSVVLEIQDDGPGLPAEVQDRLFQPFVSTKASGTGLGLYLVGRRIRAMAGEILCRSNPAGGTLFTITLPAAECGANGAP